MVTAHLPRTLLRVIAFALFCCPVAAPAGMPPSYVVDASKAAEGSVSLTLEIPDALSPDPVTVAARPLPIASASQIGGVTCNDTPLNSKPPGWELPGDCRRVRWTVTLPRVSGDVAADDQSSVFFETGWGILTDTAFLRPEGWTGPASLRIIESGGLERGESLPAMDKAPGFYLIGKPPSLQVGGSGLSLTYVADNLQEVLARSSPEQHAMALAYLREVIGPDNLRDMPELVVVWLPVSRTGSGLGGAAGGNAMLVNYFRESDNPTSTEATMSFVILLHEQFHQLVAGRLPLWASESLAQFYALKAATRTASDGSAIADLWSRTRDEARVAESLLQVQHQVLDQNDPTNYDAFYSKGVMFWRDLDLALQNASNGSRTLDSIMPRVLEAGFNADGTPSDSFRAELQPILASDLERLFDSYLTPQVNPIPLVVVPAEAGTQGGMALPRRGSPPSRG